VGKGGGDREVKRDEKKGRGGVLDERG